MRDAHKLWKHSMFKDLVSTAEIFLYDAYFTSCHITVVMLFRSEQEAPLLYKSVREENIYLNISND